jgi:hypothetical protein
VYRVTHKSRYYCYFWSTAVGRLGAVGEEENSHRYYVDVGKIGNSAGEFEVGVFVGVFDGIGGVGAG